MREMRQDRLAFDLQSARTIDPDSGHMHVRQTNISKANICPYNGDEIPGHEELGLDPNKVYQLFRHPEELKKSAERGAGDKPLVMVHRAQAVDDKDHTNRVGSVGDWTYQHPFLKGDLAIWDQVAIDAIQSGEQRELSWGYAYDPDMTPGTYEGQRFDGVMRNLRPNHVALVREGRAGADCHVFDSMEGLYMNKTAALSRTAIAGPIALAALLKPKMAKDAKPINWAPSFRGVDAKNFKSRKATIAADMKRQLAGKLAKDADMNDVVELLDALEDIIPEAGPDLEFKQIGDLPDTPVEAQDDDQADLKSVLKELGILDDDIEKVCAKMAGGGAEGVDSAPSDMSAGIQAGGGSTRTYAPEETPTGSTFENSNDSAPSNMGANSSELGSSVSTAAGTADPNAGGGGMRSYAPTDSDPAMGATDKGAKDEDDRDLEQREKDGKAFVKKVTGMDVKDLKGMVTKTAMDSAIAAAVQTAEKRATERQVAIREAERAVKPWVGDLVMSFDSADKVYRAALTHMGVDGADTMHPEAMRALLPHLPKPGEQNRQRPNQAHLAQDAAAVSDYNKRFGDHSTRLKH